MKSSWTIAGALVFAFTLAIATVVIVNWQWYQSTAEIEARLLEATPLGISEDEVIARLRQSGAQVRDPWRGQLQPNTEYPPTSVGGSSFVRALVAEYQIIFVTSVEAFYIFDSDRRLAEISVRKSTDAL